MNLHALASSVQWEGDNCFSLTRFWQRLSELANTAFKKKFWQIVDIRYYSFHPQTILKGRYCSKKTEDQKEE